MSSYAKQQFSNSGQNDSVVTPAQSTAAAKFAIIARQRVLNIRAAQHYSVGFASLVMLFALFNCGWSIYRRRSRQSRLPGSTKPHFSVLRLRSPIRFFEDLTNLGRSIRSLLLRRVPFFDSAAQALLITTYLGMNVALIVTNVTLSSSNLLPVAKRLGWIAILNLVLVVFLALKNTPLAFLTGHSYDRLNILHQIGGYATILSAVLHGLVMCLAWRQKGRLEVLIEPEQIPGIIAGLALLFILATALTFKKARYELFYVAHILLFVLVIVTVAMHQRHFENKAIIMTLLAASIWSSDRILRGFRVLWYSKSNHATVTPLSNGGTRIVLDRPPSGAVPGAHCFLWIPKIRSFESHPFTIVSSTRSSLEFVVAACDGFTRELHNFAQKNPGASLCASVDGPYGVVPTLAKVTDKVIFIAGGSGASFTFGVALETLKKRGDTMSPRIEFLWTAKNQERLNWFEKELSELTGYQNVNITLHSTQVSSPLLLPARSLSSTSSPNIDEEKFSFAPAQGLAPTSEVAFSCSIKSGNVNESLSSLPSSEDIVAGRPDLEKRIRDFVQGADAVERLAVVACGPDSLRRCVRETVADCVAYGPDIELYIEQFGW